LLRQGVTPEKLALNISLGIALGVFPALGTTTALCAMAALFLRLNLPAVQIVNYFVYPLQVAVLVPLFRLGEKLFHAPHLPISVPQISAMIHASVGRDSISVDGYMARHCGVVAGGAGVHRVVLSWLRSVAASRSSPATCGGAGSGGRMPTAARWLCWDSYRMSRISS
jgi:uncharacterized protein (DUF2062 family)